jgi:uncharacterized protein (DUF427 family)
MTYIAKINDTTIAESDDTIKIEGNEYFPPESLASDLFTDSQTAYHCPWKGDAQYFHVTIEGETYEDAAWSYPTPPAEAIEKVGEDFSDYAAFDETQAEVLSA